MSNSETYRHQESFTLESGEILKDIEIAYHTYGKYDPKRTMLFGYAMRSLQTAMFSTGGKVFLGRMTFSILKIILLFVPIL
jgi:hypothetical protein